MKKRLRKKKKQVKFLIYLFKNDSSYFNVIIHSFPMCTHKGYDSPLTGYQWIYDDGSYLDKKEYGEFETITLSKFEMQIGRKIYCEFKCGKTYYRSGVFHMHSNLQKVIRLNGLHLQNTFKDMQVYWNK